VKTEGRKKKGWVEEMEREVGERGSHLNR